MAKKTFFFILFSAFYLLMQGGNPLFDLQIAEEISTGDVPPLISTKSGTDTTICLRNTVFRQIKPVEKEVPTGEIPPVIIPMAKIETDSLRKDTKPLNLSKLGSIEYLVKWINLLVKMS